MARVSIILPTYNGARYLPEQIRSIQAQTELNWHLLICDDGSSDDTVAVTAALAGGDRRITIMPSSGNLGQQRRLKQLADAADTDLIAVSDQDDVWSPDKLALLLDRLGSADLCFGASWLIDGEGRELGRDIAHSLRPPIIAGERLTLLTRPLVSAHAMIARRALFNNVVFARATPFDWLMSVEAAWSGGMVYVPEACTRHRLHGGNQSNASFADTVSPQRFVSRSAVRTLPQMVRRGRFHLLAMLEHLAHADTVAPDRRDRARLARAACAGAWYPVWASGYRANRTLPDRLEELLRPIAGSDDDWTYFRLHLEALCAPLYAPQRLFARKRRLSIEWPS